jgi:hypothetical protein
MTYNTCISIIYVVLGRTNKNSYRPPEINKGESPKYCSYCKRKDTLFQNVLEINTESISQDSIACNALKDPLMIIVIENANLRFPNVSLILWRIISLL